MRHVATFAGPFIRAIDHPAIAILHIVDHRRLIKPSVIGQSGIGIDHPQHGGVTRAKRKGGIGLVGAFISNVHRFKGVDDVLHPGVHRDVDGHQVLREGDAVAQRLRAGRFAVVVLRPPHAEARALVDPDGEIVWYSPSGAADLPKSALEAMLLCLEPAGQPVP